MADSRTTRGSSSPVMRENAFAFHRDAHQADGFFDEWVQLFDDDQLFNGGSKLPDQLLGERPGHAQAQDGGIGEDFFGILVSHTCR